VSMKRVRELEQLWRSEFLEYPDTDWDSRAVVNELGEALKPDWHPASQPPDDSRYVWGLTISDARTMVRFDQTCDKWLHFKTLDEMDGVNEVVKWHEIEVPEPPEVGA